MIYNGSETTYNATKLIKGAYRVQVAAYNFQNTSAFSEENFVATSESLHLFNNI